MRNDNEIIEFLTKPEIIESTLDLYECTPPAIDSLHVKFWDRLKEIVELELRQRGLGNQWIATLEPDDTFVSGHGQLRLTTRQEVNLDKKWSYYVEQGYNPSPKSPNRVAPLTCGLCCWDDGRVRSGIRRAAELPVWARGLFDRPPAGWESGDLTWGYLVQNHPGKIRERNTLIRLAHDDGFEHEVARLLLELFDRTREVVERENEQLAAQEPPRRRGRRTPG